METRLTKERARVPGLSRDFVCRYFVVLNRAKIKSYKFLTKKRLIANYFLLIFQINRQFGVTPRSVLKFSHFRIVLAGKDRLAVGEAFVKFLHSEMTVFNLFYCCSTGLL